MNVQIDVLNCGKTRVSFHVVEFLSDPYLVAQTKIFFS